MRSPFFISLSNSTFWIWSIEISSIHFSINSLIFITIILEATIFWLWESEKISERIRKVIHFFWTMLWYKMWPTRLIGCLRENMLYRYHILFFGKLLPCDLCSRILRRFEKILFILVEKVSKSSPRIVSSFCSESELIADKIIESIDFERSIFIEWELDSFLESFYDIHNSCIAVVEISNGSKDEKREILGMIQADIILKDKKVYIEKSGSFKVS